MKNYILPIAFLVVAFFVTGCSATGKKVATNHVHSHSVVLHEGGY